MIISGTTTPFSKTFIDVYSKYFNPDYVYVIIEKDRVGDKYQNLIDVLKATCTCEYEEGKMSHESGVRGRYALIGGNKSACQEIFTKAGMLFNQIIVLKKF